MKIRPGLNKSIILLSMLALITMITMPLSMAATNTSNSSPKQLVSSDLIIVARGTDSAVYYKFYDGISWSGWNFLGGTIIADPSVAKFGGNIYVFAVGTDSQLYYKVYNGVSWSGWISLGGTIIGDPGAS